jgi:hypothetical protein
VLGQEVNINGPWETSVEPGQQRKQEEKWEGGVTGVLEFFLWPLKPQGGLSSPSA